MTDREERDQREAGNAQLSVALSEIVRAHLPIEAEVTGPSDAWPVVGPALIARQVGALEAVSALHPLDREADAFVVLRSPHEHAVTFAWPAVEPGEERQQMLLKSDAVSRLKADNDARGVGVALLDSGMRQQLEVQRDNLPKEMPVLADRASVSDTHWTGRVPGLGGPKEASSYRGLYAIAYRRQSAIAHPSLWGINPVTVDLSETKRRIQLEEREDDSHGPFGMGNVMVGFSLYIANHTLGWPDTDDVNTAFEIGT